jgi:glycosyltransferase involved in cell wall biosynthesis
MLTGDIARMPKVDVIIPAYNAAKFLPAAIESVIAQTFTDWRILLVDDGSTDNTAEVVSPFIHQLGPKLKYIKQANSGVSAARNEAIRNSSAEFLALLDADDIWLPHRLSESLRCFENRPQVGLAYGFNARINSEGRVIDTFARRQKHGEGKIAPYIYRLQVDLPTLTITFRKRCIDEAGLFDETMQATEDRDLWFRIASRYEVALVPQVIAHYRLSPSSATTNPERMLRSQLRFIQKNYGAEGCGILSRQIALSRVYKQQAEDLSGRRQPWAALATSLRAVALYPLDISNVRTAGSLFLNSIASLARS